MPESHAVECTGTACQICCAASALLRGFDGKKMRTRLPIGGMILRGTAHVIHDTVEIHLDDASRKHVEGRFTNLPLSMHPWIEDKDA